MAGRYLADREFIADLGLVSILARLNGRALRVSRRAFRRRPQSFQSSPGLMAGCYFWSRSFSAAGGRFQSSPGLMAGRYLDRERNSTNDAELVSILARLNGRALL